MVFASLKESRMSKWFANPRHVQSGLRKAGGSDRGASYGYSACGTPGEMGELQNEKTTLASANSNNLNPGPDR
jgi:hypothetical protein